MCYTPLASITAFVVNACASLVLMRYDAALGLFFFFVGLMQLYDLVFWTHPGVAEPDASINFWVTKLAMVTNNLQPIVLALLIAFVKRRRLGPVALVLLGMYALVVVPYTARSWREVEYTRVDEHSSPSLNWRWNTVGGYVLPYSLHLATLVALLLVGFDWPINAVLAAVCVASFVLSYHYYKGKTAVGRFWCYFACYIPLFIAAMLMARQHQRGGRFFPRRRV